MVSLYCGVAYLLRLHPNTRDVGSLIWSPPVHRRGRHFRQPLSANGVEPGRGRFSFAVPGLDRHLRAIH